MTLERFAQHSLFLLVALHFASTLSAFEVGEQVIAVTDARGVIHDGRINTYPFGASFTIEKVSGRQFYAKTNDGVGAWYDKADFVRTRDAIPYMTERLQWQPNNYLATNSRGMAHDVNGHLHQAVADYSTAIRLQPRNATAHFNRALCNRKLGLHQKVIDDFTTAIRLGYQPAATLFNDRGAEYNALDRFDEALRDFNMALELRPNHALYLQNRALIYKRKEQYARAIRAYDAALQVAPGDAMSHYQRGECYRRTGEFDTACNNFSTAIQLDPMNVPAFSGRAQSREAKSDYVGAIADYAIVSALDPAARWTILRRASCREEIGDFVGAIKDYELCLATELDKQAQPFLRNAIAWILSTAPEPAVRDGERAVKLAKAACDATQWKNASYLDTLAAAYAEAGNFEQAVEFQRRAIASNVDKHDEDGFRQRLELYNNNEPFRRTHKQRPGNYSAIEANRSRVFKHAEWSDGGPLLYVIPRSCDTCRRNLASLLVLAGNVRVWRSDSRDEHASMTKQVVVKVRGEDTRRFPDALSLAHRESGIRVDVIDSLHEEVGLATIRELLQENTAYSRVNVPGAHEFDGLRYAPEDTYWEPNSMNVFSVPHHCERCDHKLPHIQMLRGMVASAKVTVAEGPDRGEVGWTDRPFGVSSFLHPNDRRSFPEPLEVAGSDDNFSMYAIREGDRTAGLSTLRREWEKAHRD